MNVIQIIYNNGNVVFLTERSLDDEEVADLVLQIERQRRVNEVIVYKEIGQDENGNIVFTERNY